MAAQAEAGGALREELVFFYGLQPEEEGPAATAWLRRLWPTSGLPMPHPPVLLHHPDTPAPGSALEAGFACIPLRGADAEAVRRSLREAGHTAAAVQTRKRSRASRASRGRCDALAAALGCDRVDVAAELSPSAATRMAASLLAAAPQLRGSLDAPWRGLSLRLLPAANGATAACEVRDGWAGGLALEVRGDEGVATAPTAVRGAWRLLRAGGRRRDMLEELAARLRLAAAETAPLLPPPEEASLAAAEAGHDVATAELLLGRQMRQQLGSLSAALQLLRSEHVALPPEVARERLTLAIGGADAPRLQRGTTLSLAIPNADLCLRMPSSFGPEELLEQLHLAAAAIRIPGGSKLCRPRRRRR